MLRFLVFSCLTVLLLLEGFFGYSQRRLCGTPLQFSQKTGEYIRLRGASNFNGLTSIAAQNTLPDTQLAIIPVVFHIVRFIDRGIVQNDIPDARILEQIQILNNDFRRLPNTRGFNNLPVSADALIEFRLANRDPQGNPSNGIVRVNGNRRVYSVDNEVEMKSLSQWDPSRYLNIWVCNLDMLLGYAQFPITDLPGPSGDIITANTDGVVLLNSAVGLNSAQSGPYNLGRTATHEIGHYLGLFHIWGDEDDCSGSDFCDDTPPQAGEFFGCPAARRTCSANNMIANYMNYTDDACVNIFTRDQIGRMRYVLANSLRRNSLLSSNGYVVTAKEKLELPSVSVYPNPVEQNSSLTIELIGADKMRGILSVKAVSTLGAELLKQEFQEPQQQVLINTQKWTRGVYLLHISTQSGELVQKVMLR